MRHQLTINPKEVGSTIKVGKLPILTRSLMAMADMTNVVQFKTEGRYYAVELRKPKKLVKALDETREQTVPYITNYKDDSGIDCATYTKEKVVKKKEETEKSTPIETKSPFKTHYQVGRDRFEQLKELERSGGLAECKDRLDICERMGFERKISGTGYNWLSMQIRKGYLREELVRYNKQNSGEYKYYLTEKEPNYTGNKHIIERAKPQGLEELGFVNLSKPVEQIQTKAQRHHRPKGIDYAGRPVERGYLSLWEWLNKDDFVINELLISDTGRPLLERTVTRDDISQLFLEKGLPDRGKRNPAQKGQTAQNNASAVIAQLLRKGVLQKEEGSEGKIAYSLSLSKGGAYARGLSKTIREGKYSWDSKNYRRFVSIG